MTNAQLAKIMLEEAIKFMADKAGVTCAEIEVLVTTDESAANYCASLITSGIMARHEGRI